MFTKSASPNGLAIFEISKHSYWVNINNLTEYFLAPTAEFRVKVAIGQFREFHTMQGQRVGNVELILDRNHHNTDPECQRLISKAYLHDGRFRAVSCISQIDSSASRLLQLADVVAYARTWIHRGEENAKGLHEKFGIRVL